MDKLLLSIVIPCYNTASYLDETLQRLLHESLTDTEVILVNDGSTDSTELIINSYKEKFENIIAISQKNAGVSAARNKGLEISSGKFVLFFDSDDSFKKGTIKYYKEKINGNPEIDVMAFGYLLQHNNKRFTKISYNELDKKSLSPNEMIEKIIDRKVRLHICSMLFRRGNLIVNDIKFKEGMKLGEDSLFIRKAIISSQTIVYYSKIGYEYRFREDSATHKENKYTMDNLESLKEIFAEKEILERRIGKEVVHKYLQFEYARHLYYYLRANNTDSRITEYFINHHEIYSNSSFPHNSREMFCTIMRIFPMKILRIIKS